jgi:hypothetical protein
MHYRAKGTSGGLWLMEDNSMPMKKTFFHQFLDIFRQPSEVPQRKIANFHRPLMKIS